MSAKLNPVHPGEILHKEFMPDFNLELKPLAKSLGIKSSLLKGLIEGKVSIDQDMAISLSKFFNTSIGFWLNLQKSYDEKVANQNGK